MAKVDLKVVVALIPWLSEFLSPAILRFIIHLKKPLKPLKLIISIYKKNSRN